MASRRAGHALGKTGVRWSIGLSSVPPTGAAHGSTSLSWAWAAATGLSVFNTVSVAGRYRPALGWLPGCLGEGRAWSDRCGGWQLWRWQR